MPNKKITLTTGQDCDGNQTIIADPPVVTLPNDNWKIKFVNKLDGDPTAFVEFFDVNDKGGSPLGEFCPQVGADDRLEVPGNDKKKCNPEDSGDYAYIVTADEHLPLDPVIIIKPNFEAFLTTPFQPDQPTFPGGEFGGYALLALSAPLFIGILAGMYIGRKMGR